MATERAEDLTSTERVFIEEYLSNGFVASRAYAVAYPNAGEKSLTSSACNLLKRPRVKKEVQRRLDAEIGDKEMLTSKVLRKLTEIAFSNKTDEHYNATSQLRAIDLLQKQLGLQIKNIKNEISSKEFEINILPKNEKNMV